MNKQNHASAIDKALPANADAERFLLGSILLDDSRFVEIYPLVTGDDFALEKHRKIYTRMIELHESGEKIDRVTLANLLIKYSELESVDGLSYLVSLDDGIPSIQNFDGYIRIIRDKAQVRRIAYLSENTLLRSLSGAEDSKALLGSLEEQLSELTGDERGGGRLKSVTEVIQGVDGGMNRFLDPSKRAKGIKTGFIKLDEMTLGLRPQELTVLAARPSMGKTALALNIAWYVAVRQFAPTAIFSVEMSDESLLNRMVCAAARVDSQRFKAGYCIESERQKLRAAANQLVEAPLYIDDSVGITVPYMRAAIKRHEKRTGEKIRLVILDYLQLLEGKAKAENRNQEVSKISRGLKLLSKELDCHVIALSQLSRAPEARQGDHRPKLADLRESGSIEQDADIVAFLFREEIYRADREDLRGLAELIIGKQRSGPLGTVDLVFLHSLTKFESRNDDGSDLVDETI